MLCTRSTLQTTVFQINKSSVYWTLLARWRWCWPLKHSNENAEGRFNNTPRPIATWYVLYCCRRESTSITEVQFTIGSSSAHLARNYTHRPIATWYVLLSPELIEERGLGWERRPRNNNANAKLVSLPIYALWCPRVIVAIHVHKYKYKYKYKYKLV